MSNSTATRDIVATIWSDVLGVPVAELGNDSDFFLLGGHSLLATQMIARVERVSGARVRLRDVLDHPTLGQFVELLTGTAVNS